MSVVEIPITLQTPAGPLTVTLTTQDDKLPVPAVVGPAATLSDALNGAAIRLAAQHGHPVQCRNGCGACCRQLVPVSPIEAFALQAAFQRMPADQQQRIRARIDETREALRESGLDAKLQNIPPGPEGRAIVFAYFDLQRACPFLEDESCTVYESRPFACRDLLVASDPTHCDTPAAGQVRRIPMLMDMGRAVRSVSAAAFGDVTLQMPLPLALDWAEKNDSLLGTLARGVDLVKGLMSALAGQRSR